MEIVARWTGRHGLALAESMRLPREVFARKLGISPRTVADWAKQPGMPLALKTQELLDVVLDQGSPTVRKQRSGKHLDAKIAGVLASVRGQRGR